MLLMIRVGWLILLPLLLNSCENSTDNTIENGNYSTSSTTAATARMVKRLALIADNTDPLQNSFMNHERVELLQQLTTSISEDLKGRVASELRLAQELLRAGDSEQAALRFMVLADRVQQQPDQFPDNLLRRLRSLRAISLLRVGEQANCLALHNSSSCLFPIDKKGMHRRQLGSREAMAELTMLLNENPGDLVSRWLYNLAAMTVGEYPHNIPPDWLIPLDTFASEYEVGRFRDVAAAVGLATVARAGGSITEDFDGDGYLDVMTSSWGLRDQLRLYRNEGNGYFTEITEQAGLKGIVSGLNIVQADYDNDGDNDVLILRGAWLIRSGQHPNSLLRNDGSGHFEDVTEAAGLLSFNPTQAAAWGDYDNDGWLDLYIGNEAQPGQSRPSELYRNNGDGSFTDVATKLGVDTSGFIKGVVWGDYDNDGWLDLYLSRIDGPNLLFRNEAAKRFREVAKQAGVDEPWHSFPTWFWDYDNDGWLDLFAADYPPNAFAADAAGSFGEGQPYQIIADYLNLGAPKTTPRLYRNNQDGTFTDVAKISGLTHPLLAMGANFGDIDNDGYPDIYLGTGAPDFRALLPNRMFRNANGQFFQDVTTSAGVGHLQKGHGVSFADLDNDGDQDIFTVIGGAFSGDVYQNVLFINPGHGQRWLTLRLEGVASNSSAIAARIRVDVETTTGVRQIFATVGSGGSFGASSLQQEIGLGDALAIRSIEIQWPGGDKQIFYDVPMDRILRVREGEPDLIPVNVKRLIFAQPESTQSD